MGSDDNQFHGQEFADCRRSLTQRATRGQKTSGKRLRDQKFAIDSIEVRMRSRNGRARAASGSPVWKLLLARTGFRHAFVLCGSPVSSGLPASDSRGCSFPTAFCSPWPQFYLGDAWLSVEALFGSLTSLATKNPFAFVNDAESLFDALEHTAVDFSSETAGCAAGQCDLSQYVISDAGVFASRDDLFAKIPLFQCTLRGRAFEMIYGGGRSV